MEPATKQDLKDLLKEFREEFRESIKEAVAEAFGNSKPALEHATTSTASQLVAMDAKVPPPACSSPDQGTSALYLAPTATIDIVPELDIDATGVVPPTPTTCSTKCPSRDATSSTSLFTLGTTPMSAAATIDVTPVLAASVVTNDFTTPSRLLQAAAPAPIHELKVLRPLPWPSFKCSQVSTLWQLENFMNHTKVPSVGIIVQKNNCSKHLVSQAVGRCLFMIRHMEQFLGDELLCDGPKIILSVWPLECLQSLQPEPPWLSILTHVGIEVEERGLHWDVGLILQAWYYYLGTHDYSGYYLATEDATRFLQIGQQLGNTELKGNRLNSDTGEKWHGQLVFEFRASELKCRLGKSTAMLKLLLECLLQKLQHVRGGKIYGLHTPWNLVQISTSQTGADCCTGETSALVEKFFFSVLMSLMELNVRTHCCLFCSVLIAN